MYFHFYFIVNIYTHLYVPTVIQYLLYVCFKLYVTVPKLDGNKCFVGSAEHKWCKCILTKKYCSWTLCAWYFIFYGCCET